MEPEIPVKDAYNFVYFTFLALGMAILLPWSSLVTALDYFIVKLPGHDVDFVVSILSNGPFFATNVLMIIFGKWFGVKRVVGICMMLMMVLTLALPLIPQVAGSEGAWIWVVSIIITISAVNGVMQCCAYGLAGSLADHNIATLNTGIGLSGLTVSIARVISLVFFPTDGTSENDNFFYGAIMYFAIGGVFLIIGVILLVILPKTRYYQYHIDEEEDKEYLACLGRGDSPVTTPLLPDNSYKNVESFSHMMKIHNELLITGYGFTFIYIQTFCVYPAVLLKGNLSFLTSKSWEVWLIITIFCLMDTISRIISEKWMLLTHKTTALFTMLRWVPIIFCFFSAYEVPFFSLDAFKLVNLVIIGFTNGYIGNCQIMVSVNKASAEEKEITAKFLSAFRILGVLVGSLVSSFGIVHMF